MLDLGCFVMLSVLTQSFMFVLSNRYERQYSWYQAGSSAKGQMLKGWSGNVQPTSCILTAASWQLLAILCTQLKCW